MRFYREPLVWRLHKILWSYAHDLVGHLHLRCLRAQMFDNRIAKGKIKGPVGEWETCPVCDDPLNILRKGF